MKKSILSTIAGLFLIIAGSALSSPQDGVAVPSDSIQRGVHFFAFFDIDNKENSSSVGMTTDDFSSIINEIKSGEYEVISIADAVDAIKSGKVFAKPAIVLSFDGAYSSFYTNAFPLLKEAGFPFTVFITTEQVNQISPFYMNWDVLDDIKETDGATIALHSDVFVPLNVRNANDIRFGINRAVTLFEEKIGYKPEYIAYPFGLYDEKVLDIIAEYPFIKAGFSLHSSVADSSSLVLSLPRFTLAGDYADIDRFRTLAHALPLPVHDLVPGRTNIISKDTPSVGFTIDESISNFRSISCFARGLGRLQTEFLGQRRVELRLPSPLEEGTRIRINCTLPSKDPADGANNWRWFGLLLQPR